MLVSDLVSDAELRRRLKRAAAHDRDRQWRELYDLASDLAFFGAVDEALDLWRLLYASSIPVPGRREWHIYGDLTVSAVCYKMEVPDISCGVPSPKYVAADLPLAKRLEAQEQYIRRELARPYRPYPGREDLPIPEPYLTFSQAMNAIRPERGESYSQMELEGLAIIRRLYPETEPLTVYYERALLLAADIEARHGLMDEAGRTLRRWCHAHIAGCTSFSELDVFGLRSLAGLVCSGLFSDKITMPRPDLQQMVVNIATAQQAQESRPVPLVLAARDLIESLEWIMVKIGERGSRLPALLAPGLTRIEIDALTAPLGFRLPEEVYRIYMWRNGVSLPDGPLDWDDYCLFDGIQRFLPLEEALRSHNGNPLPPEQYSGILLPEIVDELNGATLFPLFEDDMGCAYHIACRTERTETGQIVDAFAGGEEPRIVFRSLTRMMHVLADLYEAGAEGPYLTEDASP